MDLTYFPDQMKTDMEYDLSELRKFSRGDKDFELDMIQTFINECIEYSDLMNQHYNTNNYQGLGGVAHKFKSSVSIFKMERFLGVLAEIENTCKAAGDHPGLPESMNSMQVMVAQLLESMNREMENYHI